MPLIDLLPLWLWATLFILALEVVLVVLWHAAVTGSFRFSEPPDPGSGRVRLVPRVDDGRGRDLREAPRRGRLIAWAGSIRRAE